MTEYNDVVADGREDPFDSERRGYARRQVDEYLAWRNGQIRELESKLTQGLSRSSGFGIELAKAREAGGRPAHEEVSERVGQILKLAADEAKAERDQGGPNRPDARCRQVRDRQAQGRRQGRDRPAQGRGAGPGRAHAYRCPGAVRARDLLGQGRGRRPWSAAQQAADQTVADATSHADSTVTAAIAQAKQQLDDATARATAIHDGAERRLNLLISRHTETVRRLTEIRDVVTSLVAGEAARGSLEDEVNRALSGQGNSAPTERQAASPPGSPTRRMPVRTGPPRIAALA